MPGTCSRSRTRWNYRSNGFLSAPKKILLFAQLNHVEVLKQISMIRCFLILSTLVHEPNAIQAVIRAVISDPKNLTDLPPPQYAALRERNEPHDRLRRNRSLHALSSTLHTH